MEAIIKTFLLSLLCSSSCFAYKNLVEETDENFLLNLVWKCTRADDVGHCLKLKAVKLLDRMVRTKDPLVISDYLTLAKNPKIYSNYQEPNATQSHSEGKSAKTEEEKNENLDNLMWEKLVSLFTTRTIQLSLSPEAFEGRGKGDKIFKKGHGVFLMAGMMGGMMMKMAMAKIALIAGKALIIAKIALVLALLIALKKFASHGGGGGGGAEVVYTSAEHGSGRKFETDSFSENYATDLAYSAYKPEIYKNF